MYKNNIPNVLVAAPAISPPAPGHVYAAYLRGVKSVISSLYGDPIGILERNNIDPSTVEDEYCQIDCDAVVNLLEYCSQTLDDPLFGLRLATSQEPDVWGVVVALARSAPSILKALQCFIEYQSVSNSPEGMIEIVTGKDVVELRFSSRQGNIESQQIYFQCILLLMKVLRTLAGTQFCPRYASLSFGIDSRRVSLLQEQLSCRVRTRADFSSIAFSRELLELPVATNNSSLYSILESYLKQLKDRSQNIYINTDQIESYVWNALPTGECSMANCASELGISVRTLHKRLAGHGARFSDITQDQRIKAAKHLLLWSDYTLDDIADRLGYASQTNFGRAFKKSIGVTPLAYRAHNLRLRKS